MTTNTWEMRYGGGGRELSKIQGRRKTPSFSSSLLDAIYNSIDVSESKQQQEAMVVEERETENGTTAGLHGGGAGGGRRRRNHATTTTAIQLEEEEMSSLRRAIMVDKWMENYPSGSRRKTRDNYSTRRVNSDSSSSTDSSFFSSSSETESGSKSSSSATIAAVASNRKHEGRFMTRTKSRALKIYGDLKKVKQPISPGGKIANFLNSIFNSNKKHLHHHHQVVVEDEHWNSVRKSRSVNDSYSTRSCFIRQPPPALSSSSSTRTKSQKRSVRFCPVGVIIDEYSQACGHTSIIYDNDPRLNLTLTPIPSSNSSSSRHYNYQEEENNTKKKKKKHKCREFEFEFFNHDEEDDEDGNSCTSSDLFELENIGLIGMGTGGGEELPVYGTTNLKKNQAIIYSSSQKGCV